MYLNMFLGHFISFFIQLSLGHGVHSIDFAIPWELGGFAVDGAKDNDDSGLKIIDDSGWFPDFPLKVGLVQAGVPQSQALSTNSIRWIEKEWK